MYSVSEVLKTRTIHYISMHRCTAVCCVRRSKRAWSNHEAEDI